MVPAFLSPAGRSPALRQWREALHAVSGVFMSTPFVYTLELQAPNLVLVFYRCNIHRHVFISTAHTLHRNNRS
jgi:hypothetical protein